MKKLILLSLMALSQSLYAKIAQDSLKTTVVKNYIFIKHSVEPKQTLYAISKKYNCSMAQIFSANPILNNNPNLKLGQIVLVPFLKSNKLVPIAISSKEIKKLDSEIKKDLASKSPNAKEHVVVTGETLFSIAKKYDLSVAELCKMNNIENNQLQIGRILVIDKALLTKVEPIKTTEQLKTPLPIGIKIAEEGIAEVIKTKSKSQKSLALHRSAPIGSVVMITNEATGASTMAKVIGNINSNGPDQDILIKLSPAAFRKLQPKDSKIRARVVYFTKNFGII